MEVRPALAVLPAEILEAIFLQLDYYSVVQASQACKHIRNITAHAPVIWRHLCLTNFNYWDPHRHIQDKIAAPLSNTDWRELFIERYQIDKDTRHCLDRVINTPHGRLQLISDVANYGYDAKGLLLREWNCPDDAGDVLARRFYAHVMLQRIQREEALRIWMHVGSGNDVPLEKVLFAFDLFTRVGDDVDLDVFTSKLDNLAKLMVAYHPNFHDLSTRQKASALAMFLHERGFNGAPDDAYRNLRNSFIGLALESEDHHALPLIHVAIYCAVASRLGLDARPCGYIYHVYCIVYAPENHTLDGAYKPNSDGLDSMYLNPFGSGDEVERSELERTLRDAGIPSEDHGVYLSAAPVCEMALRTSRNILNAVRTFRHHADGRHHDAWASVVPDVDAAVYAAVWAFVMVSGRSQARLASMEMWQRYLPRLLESFQTYFPWDITLLEKYLLPYLGSHPGAVRLAHFMQDLMTTDAQPKTPHRRGPESSRVSFKVGQLFKHARYGYEGVVTGWDPACDAGEEWISHMQVDELPNGRNQSFYHILACDKSVRYVAEENIRPVPPETQPSKAICMLAGRHFKRWDPEARMFVSNVRHEYPDD
ncbi:YccV-like-domain-containing protein [Sporormia fimetaria CBS 119925]|uniref:YccV-like-domain-containing protein n=1 Tax=Sporormia fimetaria CBS 119925 TaxID=1340428 RepID=A0A6A6VS51_9PLEO|nr:YccV-like-domain-containing protein [Sporormia fimetaria CBS 119925]